MTTDYFKTYAFLVILVESGLLAESRGSDIKVLVGLLRHINSKTRQCFPSLVRLSKETGLSRGVIQAAIKRLQSYGIIRKSRFNAGRKFKCVYSIIETPKINLPIKQTKSASRPDDDGDKSTKLTCPIKQRNFTNPTSREIALITRGTRGTRLERENAPSAPSRGNGPNGPCVVEKSSSILEENKADDFPDGVDVLEQAASRWGSEWKRRYLNGDPGRGVAS